MVTKTSHLPIRYFLALLWAHPILHISTIRVKTFTCILYFSPDAEIDYKHDMSDRVVATGVRSQFTEPVPTVRFSFLNSGPNAAVAPKLEYRKIYLSNLPT